VSASGNWPPAFDFDAEDATHVDLIDDH